jgi:two-component system nitrate/nitrite response regulator NarL
MDAVRPPVAVVVIDENAAFRGALRRLLDTMPEFDCVGEAATGDEGVDLVRELAPDLALVDLRMREMEGLRTTRRLRETHPGIVVVLMSLDSPLELPSEVGRCGAADVVRKQDLTPGLLRRLRATHIVVRS